MLLWIHQGHFWVRPCPIGAYFSLKIMLTVVYISDIANQKTNCYPRTLMWDERESQCSNYKSWLNTSTNYLLLLLTTDLELKETISIKVTYIQNLSKSNTVNGKQSNLAVTRSTFHFFFLMKGMPLEKEGNGKWVCGYNGVKTQELVFINQEQLYQSNKLHAKDKIYFTRTKINWQMSHQPD